MKSQLRQTVTISSSANGFIVRDFMPERGMLNPDAQTYVFGSFEELTEWLAENLEDNSVSG